MTNAHKFFFILSVVFISVSSSACQSIYDEEADKFCDRIENRNQQQCTGNHIPELPNG